jgi:ATP-binding cassette, subfamily B, bacterial
VSVRLTSTQELWENLAGDFRGMIDARLMPGEIPLAWLETDLDESLHYAKGLVVLTDRRLLAAGPIHHNNGSPLPENTPFQAWTLDPTVNLRTRDQAGTGMLELLGDQGRHQHWRYTAGKMPPAHRLVERFDCLRQGDQPEEDESSSDILGAICPSCGTILAPDQEVCPECEISKAKPPVQSLLRLKRFARPQIGVILLGFVLLLSGSFVSLIPPYLTMPIMNDVLVPRVKGEPVEFRLVWFYLIGLGGASVLSWLLTWARTYVLAWASERIAADLRNQTYTHLQSLSLEYYGGKRTGDLIARISSDSDRICYFLSVHLLDFANNILMLAMIAGILFYINPTLALVTLLPLPVIAFLVQRVRSRLRQGFLLGGRVWSEMTSVLADTIPGIRVVKAFAQERREVERFRTANERVFQTNNRVNKMWAFFEPIVTLLTDAGLWIVWAFSAWYIYNYPQDTHINIGVLFLFITYMNRFYSRMDSMSRFVSAMQRAGASTQRVFAILDRAPSVAEPKRPVHPGRLSGKLEFRGVGFQYGTRRVLQDVNLTIEPGEMIGLVGPSGAGKSTIVNLVCRFYDVGEGVLLGDGVDIRQYPVEEYRQHIGIVLQEPFLFFGSIAENIAYGKPSATREEIIAAARAARAHEFILRLPDGYDSMVGERGQSLSGGERQRISIARALLIDPRILILDEATSSVDTETEREIQLALENLVQGRTTIAIAHRLSTLRRADRLVVIEHGKITEVGPHSELLKRSGTYARLYHAQLEMNEGRAK